MPNHQAQQGETISRIAAAHGMSFDAVWNAPENTELRETRPDPNVLFEGDMVFIPSLEPKLVAAATGRRHTFTRIERWVPVRVQFREGGSNRPFISCSWSVDGGPREKGLLDEAGLFEIEVPPETREVEVSLYLAEGVEEHYQLQLRHLDPPSETRGVQQRLQNLGYDCGALDGDFGERTQAALGAFQRAQGLEPTGELDPDTQARLKEVHGA